MFNEGKRLREVIFKLVWSGTRISWEAGLNTDYWVLFFKCVTQ